MVLVAGTVMALGFTQLPHARVDVLPEVTPPYVQIQTEALGLSAVEVEQLVTAPMEQQLLNGVAFLDEIRSKSVPGMSSIELVFEPSTDLLEARQLVQERLTMAHDLPNVSKAPVMIQPLSSTSRLMMVGLSSEELSLIEMSVLARWKIRPRLMGVPGVANVAIWGQRERQLQVRADPERLNRNDVTLDQLIRTTANALWVSPLTYVEASTPGSGGFIDTPNQRLDLQHILPIRTPSDLARVSIEGGGGGGLTVGDVAEVVEDHQPLIGDALVRDDPSLLLVIEKFPGTNALQATRDVEDALAALRVGLPGLDVDTSVFRPADFIETAAGNIGTGLVIGLLLLTVVVALLFFAWQAALVSLLAMVMSLVAAALVLQVRDGVFNTAVLAGLVIALGAVVDDAVVDVSRVLERMRQRTAEPDEPALDTVIRDSCLAVRAPLTYAAFVSALVASPLLVLGGPTGALLRPVVVTYLLAVVVSFAVALTLTPALATLLFRRTPVTRESPVARWLLRGYRAALSRLLRAPVPVLAAVAVVAAAGLASLPGLGTTSVLPSLQDRSLLVDWEAAPGTSQPEMSRVTARVTRELRRAPGVQNVGAHVGRAITGDQLVAVNSGEIWVRLDPRAPYGESVAAVREVVAGYPGLSEAVTTYPDQVLDEMRPASDSALVARVYGTDLPLLRAKAQEVRTALLDVDGVVDPRVEAGAEEPTVEIEVDLAAAERFGLKPGDVRRAAATMVSGIEVGNLFEEQKVFEVVVWGSEASRRSLTDLHDLRIDAPSGRQVRLDDVAELRVVPNLTVIEHDAVSRYVDVVADVSGRELDSVVDAVDDRVAAIELPLEHHVEVLQGSAEDPGAWTGDAVGLAAAAVVLVLLLLQAAFGSWTLAGLVLLLLPVAAAGGAVATFATGRPTPLGAMVGLLTVLGLAARQCTLLVRRFQDLERNGDIRGAQAAVRGSTERLLPVVLTNLSLAMLLLPFAVVAGVPGHELLHPLAVVTLGGLVTSTLVTLFALPALYTRVRPQSRLGDREHFSRAEPTPG